MSLPLLSAPVKTAIIGYGFAGKSFHAYLVSLVPELQLVGIASRDAATRERIVAEQGCRAYESLDAVLADPEIELVILATPNSAHAEQAIAALNAGKHVVSDKVMCLSLAQCDAMLSAAQQNNRLLTVFQNRRFDGDFLTVQHLMASGDVGEVRWIEMAWQGFGAWGGWRGQAEMGGGRFYDLGAHLVDQLLLLFPDDVESVYCRMHHDYAERNIESEALLVVTFAGGKTDVCDLSGRTAISKPRFLVKGDRATFAKYGLDPQENAMRAGEIDAAVNAPENDGLLKSPGEERRVPTIAGRWRNYYENIAAVLTTGAELVVKPHEMRRVMSVLDAGMVSAKSGNVIHPG